MDRPTYGGGAGGGAVLDRRWFRDSDLHGVGRVARFADEVGSPHPVHVQHSGFDVGVGVGGLATGGACDANEGFDLAEFGAAAQYVVVVAVGPARWELPSEDHGAV